jgi:UDP-glucose 4-epimerase
MILVVGSAGYIGSHILKKLYSENIDVLSLDIKNNQSDRFNNHLIVDVLDIYKLEKVFKNNKIDIVIHLASLIQVNESMEYPYNYYYNNIVGTLNILELMRRYNVKKIIFSSTGSVYKEGHYPFCELYPISPQNIYSHSKYLCEELIRKYNHLYDISYCIFRFFNVCGCDPDGEVGENHEPETHLIPCLIKSMITKNKFKLYGIDYDTYDGTCIRDYIHILDIVDAHYKIIQSEDHYNQIFNLGNNIGYSVLDLYKKCNLILGKLDFELCDRREGDASVLICDNSKAKRVLDWEPKNSDIENIFKTTYNWLTKNLIKE